MFFPEWKIVKATWYYKVLIDQALSKYNLGAQLELARHLLRQGENTAALEQLHTLELSSLEPIDRMLVAIWPTLFAYQFVFEFGVRRMDPVGDASSSS